MSDAENSSGGEEDLPKGFSFFGSGADMVSDSDSDAEEEPEVDEAEQRRQRKRKKQEALTEEVGTAGTKLPGLSELLSDKKLANPSFLSSSLAEEALETKSFDKRRPPDPHMPWLKKKQQQQQDAQAPKRPVDPRVSKGMDAVAAATAMSRTYAASTIQGQPGYGAEATRQQQQKKAAANDSELSFNQREKRKRDLGQTSRGKSFVEEEKRLLRNAASNSGQGFD